MISSCPSPSSAIPHQQEEPAAVRLRLVSVPVSVSASVSVPASAPHTTHRPKPPGRRRGMPRDTSPHSFGRSKRAETFKFPHPSPFPSPSPFPHPSPSPSPFPFQFPHPSPSLPQPPHTTHRPKPPGRRRGMPRDTSPHSFGRSKRAEIAHLRKVSRKHGKTAHLRKVGEGGWKRKRAYRHYRGSRANCAPSEGGRRRLETKTRVQALQRVPGRLHTFGR